MTQVERLIAVLHTMEPEAAQYIEWLLANPDEHEKLIIGRASDEQLAVANDTRCMSSAIVMLFAFHLTPHGRAFWYGVMQRVREYEATWFKGDSDV